MYELVDGGGRLVEQWEGSEVPALDYPNESAVWTYKLTINGRRYEVPPGPLRAEVLRIIEQHR